MRRAAHRGTVPQQSGGKGPFILITGASPGGGSVITMMTVGMAPMRRAAHPGTVPQQSGGNAA